MAESSFKQLLPAGFSEPKNFFIRQPDDHLAVARAFTTLLDDPEHRRQMGRAARQRAVTEFSYDVLAERLGKSLGALA